MVQKKPPLLRQGRTKAAPAGIGRFTGALQVTPLSVERTTEMGGPALLKSFQETYIRLAKGEDGFWSTTPDSRSALPSLKMQKWVQLFGSEGVVDLYPPMP